MTLETIFHVFGVRVNRYKLIKYIVTNIKSFPRLQKKILKTEFFSKETKELDTDTIRILDLLIDNHPMDKLSGDDKSVYHEIMDTLIDFPFPDFEELNVFPLTHDVDENEDIILGALVYEQKLTVPMPSDKLLKVCRKVIDSIKLLSASQAGIHNSLPRS